MRLQLGFSVELLQSRALAELVARADAAMERAKQAGRDRVVPITSRSKASPQSRGSIVAMSSSKRA